jgi:ATP-dependent protease HslVU (ClpYQ) ATPase subunit
MDRIAVIGVTGSGKTTFARQLADRIDGVHIELDAVHWEPGWTEASIEAFRERVELATRAERWALDGNYGKVRDIAWARRYDRVAGLSVSDRIVAFTAPDIQSSDKARGIVGQRQSREFVDSFLHARFIVLVAVQNLPAAQARVSWIVRATGICAFGDRSLAIDARSGQMVGES